MFKKNSATSAIVIAVATVSGFFFSDVDDLAYEPLNGPPLVTPQFLEALAKNPISTEKLEISETNSGSKGFLILSINQYPNLFFATNVRKVNSDQYRTQLYFVPEPRVNKLSKEADEALGKDELREYIFTLKELNRLIDKRHFPDTSSRALKKQRIRNRIYNPSSSTLNEL